MGAPSRPKGLYWVAAVALAAAIALLLIDPSRGARSPGDEPGREAEPAATLGESPSSPAPRDPSPGHIGANDRDADAEADPTPGAEPVDLPEGDYVVDLERLRARRPDNLYWRLGEPTKDPQVLQARAEEEQRWNELFGKVQSNTASVGEIREYYDHRRRVSEDYLEFASLVLQEYGDELPERDRGMYELSTQLHRARLEEIPRQTEDALARKRAHDTRKEEWRAGQTGK